MKRASCLSERHLAKALADMDLNVSQAMLLVHLRDGERSMTELGAALCCHKSNVTQLVDSLSKKGCIKRCSAHQDRRVQCVKLTTKGEEMMREAYEALTKNAHVCADSLSPEESRTLTDLLETYIRRQEAKQS